LSDQTYKALESDAPVIVYTDIKSPYAFVAVRPTLELESRLGVHFDWRPITLDIPSYLGSATKSRGKVIQANRSPEQWMHIRYAYKDARRYAERQGYMLKGTEKIWDSSIANIGILWVSQRDRPRLGDYLETVFPPFWRRELDIEDVDVVIECLNAAGVESSGFRDWQQGIGRRLHDELYAQLHPAGIYGVPTYVFDGYILFGREHLPFVEWHLRGRRGQKPDIAQSM